jgi:guanylate kinase
MTPCLLIVVSGPAGVGKGSIVRKMMDYDENIVLSVSATSRPPRATEAEGVNYFFKTREQFEAMIKNDELLEWVEYCGNYYGTPKEWVCREVEKGKVVVLEIEVDGASNIRRLFPDCVLCFVIPPDFKELENRLRGRGTETDDSVKARLTRAIEEFKLIDKYDYLIMNDTIENAADSFFSIIRSERMRTSRNQLMIDNFKNLNRSE